MTFSSAWIEANDDDELAEVLAQSPGAGMLPPPPTPYWINHVRDWAQREGLAITHPGYGEIRVPVTRSQLLRFLDETLGASAPADARSSSLHDYIEKRGIDGRTYVIAAEEF